MPQRLLLVDDSPTIQRVIQLTFADERIDVVTVGSVPQAIGEIERSAPDIVLADVGMPGQNGFDLARHLRQTPSLAGVPVLLLTGAFEPIDAEQARAVGARGVLVKPFEPAVVIGRVRELIGAAAVEPPSPSEEPRWPRSDGPQAMEATTPAAEPLPRPATVARLDDYFARLDEAITARVSEAPVPALAWSPSDTPGIQPEPSEAPDADGLSGAFSELLAAEQRGSSEEAFASWVAPTPEPAPAVVTADAIGEDVIEAIVARVLARLPDTVIKEAVSTLTLTTAERVIREEIDRIKNDIT